jgi:TMEM175 potassium channel family protein
MEAFSVCLVAIPLAFMNAWLAGGLYVVVAILWLVPDRRIEQTLARRQV